MYRLLDTMIKSKGLLCTLCIAFATVYLYVSIKRHEKSVKNESCVRHIFDAKSIPDRSVNIRSSWVTEFKQRERKIYSQNGEDGVLLWIFSNIGTIDNPPRFVEFGVENGSECNTRFFRQHLGWQGLIMDSGYQDSNINLQKELITPDNINDLLAKYQTPSFFDLLSIDVNFDDYFVWKSILQAGRFQARVVVIEYNYNIPPNENRVVDPYRDSVRWTGTMHFGAGILALTALGRAHGYTLVYVDQNAVNMFFILTSILKKVGVLHKVPSLEKLYVSKPSTGWKHKTEDIARPWIWNDTMWGGI